MGQERRSEVRVMKQTIVIALVCLFSCGSIFAADGSFGGGDGSFLNPFIIEDAADLLAVNNGLRDCYQLSHDIDLAGYLFTDSVIAQFAPYDSEGPRLSFNGTLDGNGHTISNLTIRGGGEQLYIGLIGHAINYSFTPCIIKNLTLKNVDIESGQARAVGSLVGWGTSIEMTNCHVVGGSVLGQYPGGSSYVYDQNQAGGLVGWLAMGVIDRCSTRGVTVSASAPYINCGGILGGMWWSGGTVNQCYAVDGVVSGGINSGGLIGLAKGSDAHPATIYDCYSTSSVSGANSGGLIGARLESTQEDESGPYLRRSYSTGPVSGSSREGGLIGNNTSLSGRLSDCFWNMTTSGVTVSCGANPDINIIGIDNAQMENQSTYTNWDFGTVWTMDNSGYYARPMLQNNPEPDYFEITVTSGENGSVSPSGINWYIEGSDLIAEATEFLGYTVDKWYVNGTIAQVGGLLYDASPILSDMSINVTFKQANDYCEVTISHGSNGAVIPWLGTTVRVIEQGTELTIIAQPDNGYEVDQWQLNGSVYQYGSNTFTLYDTQTNVSALSVDVTFKPILYTVHITPGIPVGNGDLRIGAHGITVPTGYQSVQKGSPLSITATPETGYEVYAWQINGILCGHGLTTYEIDSVPGNMTIGVLFKNAVFAEGAGTALNPYQVHNIAALNAVNDELAAHYIMTNDIDLSGEPDYEDAVIGAGPAAPFLGVFDGNHQKITGLTIESHNDHLGLFGVVSSANGLQGQVKNLTLEGAILRSNASNVGGLCGLNQSGIIEQCRVVGVDISGNERVAGLCGYNSGTIRYSSAEGTVTGSYRVGLLTGNCYQGTIHDCYAIGNLIMENAATSGGGISGDSNQATMSNCYASCSIDGEGGNLGSFCGWSQNSSYDDCVTNRETYDVAIGGTGGGDVGTIAGLDQSQMQTMENWAATAWDFLSSDTDGTDDIWRMCQDGVDFPRLWWQFGRGDIACGDGVNLTDFATLSRNWLTDIYEPLFYDNADINGDGVIETADLIILAEHWLN